MDNTNFSFEKFNEIEIEFKYKDINRVELTRI